MSAVDKRLARLKALRTELRGLGLEGAAQEVGEEIASIEALPGEAKTPRSRSFWGR